MFRPEAMMRLRTIVQARHERLVLKALGRLGAVQLTRTAASEAIAPTAPPDRSRELARCDRLLGRIAEIRHSLGIGVGAGAALKPLRFEEAERELAVWEERTCAWRGRCEQHSQRLEQLATTCEQVEPYRSLELPLDPLAATSFLHFVTGSLPPGALRKMTSTEEAIVLPLSVHNGRQPILALTTKRGRAALEKSLQQLAFQPAALPALSKMTSQRVFAASQLEQQQLEAGLEVCKKDGQSLALAATEPLAELQHWATVERRLLEAEQFFPGTAATVLITGWIRAADLAPVRAELQAATNDSCVLEAREPTDLPEAEIPVLLHHSRWMRPFEMLVTAYGFPKYRELVPTLFVAISYVLMFGMMFGDAGHGGLLALAGAGILLANHSQRIRDLAVLLLVNGLSSASFGVVYGSYFGLPQFKRYALWHDPLEGDPLTLMFWAMGLGVVLMSFGLVLNILNRLRRRQYLECLLDKFGVTGVIFYWGALILAVKAAAIQAHGWWNGALVLFLAVPLGCWAIKEPLAIYRQRQTEPGGMAAAWTESFVGVFEGVLLYLANTISFVRLAAYAMSHAALLMATFTVADQVRGLSSGGTVLGIVVIILGNAIAMVLEGIVAAVQALRLEYYEFFGKFFAGDGQPFKPFSLVTEGRG